MEPGQITEYLVENANLQIRLNIYEFAVIVDTSVGPIFGKFNMPEFYDQILGGGGSLTRHHSTYNNYRPYRCQFANCQKVFMRGLLQLLLALPADFQTSVFMTLSAFRRGYAVEFRPFAAIIEVAPQQFSNRVGRIFRILVPREAGAVIWPARELLRPSPNHCPAKHTIELAGRISEGDSLDTIRAVPWQSSRATAASRRDYSQFPFSNVEIGLNDAFVFHNGGTRRAVDREKEESLVIKEQYYTAQIAGHVLENASYRATRTASGYMEFWRFNVVDDEESLRKFISLLYFINLLPTL
ncbi:hypothetical protein F5Y04DRAFT_286102 [Hypomontagnella monticulosa]|nr:hypothetical protein F5Y04DRAFT_286102 [Hypomontagnella monticulosa]